MSLKTLSWILLAAVALGALLLFNYWASYQLLSTLVYAGIVTALFGVANLTFPFRFLGFRRRISGALCLAGGAGLTLAALYWPAPMFHVAQPTTRLDSIMPEYQFFEKHSTRIHARPGQVIQAVRQSTFGDMHALSTLLKVRGAALRVSSQENDAFARDKRVLDVFSASGYALGGSDRELVMCGGANAREKRVLHPNTLEECASDREPGAVKMAFNFNAEDAGGGWSTVTTETRVLVLDDSARGLMSRYWRLIVPGSGMLRRQWLESIKRRAESEAYD